MSVLISKAFGFSDFQFSTRDPCCLARVDFSVKAPEGTTDGQFDRMLQNLLRERFKLAFHYQRKEMTVYELTIGSNGPKMKPSAPGAAPVSPPQSDEARVKSPDKDGYPVFPSGASDLRSNGDHYRWTAFGVSTQDIARTLSNQLHRHVVDATGLNGKYDIDLKWVSDFLLSDRQKAEIEEQVGGPVETGPGPRLLRAVQDQLGLKMSSKKGSGEVVAIDYIEKVPTAN